MSSESAVFFVGLDLSLTGTGLAVVDSDGKLLEQHTFGFGLNRTATVRQKVERLIEIALGVVRVLKKYERNRLQVGIENYAFGRVGSQNDLGELHGVIKSQLWLALRIEPKIIVATAARKAILGSGKIAKGVGKREKNKIVALLTQKGVLCDNDNVADAYVIGAYMRVHV